ncbi:facilitated trehalose transporter Tret1-like [Trichogramma pretiosum]|uniref:facilitated trehalose transporter Tret1-like n=1 Tax=Trichogramma pretiosum TaxID=7493 RepID=UPI0006C9669B|nr:facilitated trehalose transporter Tret1-like [Trichogramma pretiosum]
MQLEFPKNSMYPQWFAGIGVTMLTIHIGLIGGWSSPTLVKLTAADSSIPLDSDQASWVASLVNFSRFFGGILGAVCASYFGSKRSILITLQPIALGWLFVVIATSVEWLYASRLASGLGLGMAFATFPLFVGEVSMPEVRGALISLAIVGAPFGQVIASVCGTYLSVQVAAGIYLALALLATIIFIWLPESPHHLVKAGNAEAAKNAIYWYRAGRTVEDEFGAIERFVGGNVQKSFLDKLKEFKTGPSKKAIIQVIILFTFAQMSGLNVIMFFMETILRRGEFVLVEPSLMVIYANVCSTASAIVSIFLIDRYGRKLLLSYAALGVTLSMIGLTCHFLLMDLKVNSSQLQWPLAGSIFLFMISYFLGLLPVPNAILSETFPADTKHIASSIAGLTSAFMGFLSAKTYLPMLNAMGDTYVFLFYLICSAVLLPYAIFVLTETKGKPLQQIQDELMTK